MTTTWRFLAVLATIAALALFAPDAARVAALWVIAAAACLVLLGVGLALLFLAALWLDRAPDEPVRDRGGHVVRLPPLTPAQRARLDLVREDDAVRRRDLATGTPDQLDEWTP